MRAPFPSTSNILNAVSRSKISISVSLSRCPVFDVLPSSGVEVIDPTWLDSGAT